MKGGFRVTFLGWTLCMLTQQNACDPLDLIPPRSTVFFARLLHGLHGCTQGLQMYAGWLQYARSRMWLSTLTSMPIHYPTTYSYMLWHSSFGDKVLHWRSIPGRFWVLFCSCFPLGPSAPNLNFSSCTLILPSHLLFLASLSFFLWKHSIVHSHDPTHL